MPQIKPVHDKEGNISHYIVFNDEGEIIGTTTPDGQAIPMQSRKSKNDNNFLSKEVIAALVTLFAACIGIFSCGFALNGTFDLRDFFDEEPEVIAATEDPQIEKIETPTLVPSVIPTTEITTDIETQVARTLTAIAELEDEGIETATPTSTPTNIANGTPIPTSTARIVNSPVPTTRSGYCTPMDTCIGKPLRNGQTFNPAPPTDEEWWYIVQVNQNDGKFFLSRNVNQTYTCESNLDCSWFGYYTTLEFAVSEMSRTCDELGTSCAGYENP